MKRTKIHILRMPVPTTNTETEANKKDIFIGSRSNIPLTNDGLKQAQDVGRYFKSIGVTFDVIYHSPMFRCYQTASEISAIAGGQLVEDKRLLELDYGDWEGLPRTDIVSKYPDDYHRYCTDMSFAPTGSSECANDVSVRITDFLNDLKTSDNITSMGKTVLVVTHKTAGRILLRKAGHNSDGHFREIPFDNAAIRYVSIKSNKTIVILDNKRC